MGACLHEVETLAFLKVKRQEAGLTHERSRFAELASWFYRRSAVGGVDHVCLVFRGGGLSLREAMWARSPPISAAQSGVTASSMPSSAPALLVWKAHELVEVARGLLEVRALPACFVFCYGVARQLLPIYCCGATMGCAMQVIGAFRRLWPYCWHFSSNNSCLLCMTAPKACHASSASKHPLV